MEAILSFLPFDKNTFNNSKCKSGNISVTPATNDGSDIGENLPNIKALNK